jgi:hypothetical protein
MLGDPIRPYFPTQHQFSEKHTIGPGQCRAANCHLILNNGPARFDRPGVAIVL